VLSCAERNEVSRIVLASSGAVYDWASGPLGEETTPLRAADNYALAKLTNERQLAFWRDRCGGVARVVRIFNTIGHDDPNAHLIPDVLDQIPPGTQQATIALGNLAPRRDYIHAEDTARGIEAVLQDPRQGKPWDVFNIASGIDFSVGELVTEIGAAMGARIEIVEDAARKRRIDRLSQLGAVDKIAQVLGWRAERGLGDALKDITANYWAAKQAEAR
jgi:UDP-glucose 4-epimerase